MLKIKYFLIGVVALHFVACKRPGQEIIYPPTLHIDTADYKQIQNKFPRVSLFKIDDHLGGLTPNYPIAIANQMLIDFHGKPLSKDTDWVTGGFIPQALKIAVKIDGKYILINNRKELEKIYAPISTTQEALAYAVLYTRSFPAFKDFFDKTKYEYVKDKPEISYSIKEGGHYKVHLFSYVTFGCDHPFYSEIYQVNTDGTVTLLSRVRSFIDPKKRSLCVD